MLWAVQAGHYEAGRPLRPGRFCAFRHPGFSGSGGAVRQRDKGVTGAGRPRARPLTDRVSRPVRRADESRA